MSSFSIIFLFVAIITLLFLAINFVLAPRSPYQEKLSPFECGFHSFHQTRSQFHLSFFIYALIYLILDLEIILLYPYALSAYENGIYGLVIILLFTLIITVGFIYELGSGALHIDSRQYNHIKSLNVDNPLQSSIFIFPIVSVFLLPFWVYLIFDLNILLLLNPYFVSAYDNGVYYLVIMFLFIFIPNVGFIYELGSGAFHIYSIQYNVISKGSLGFYKLNASLRKIYNLYDNLFNLLKNPTSLALLLISLGLALVNTKTFVGAFASLSYGGLSSFAPIYLLISISVVLVFLLFNFFLHMKSFRALVIIFTDAVKKVFTKNNIKVKLFFVGFIWLSIWFIPGFNVYLGILFNWVFWFKTLYVIKNLKDPDKEECVDYIKFILNINLVSLLFFLIECLLGFTQGILLMDGPSSGGENNSSNGSSNNSNNSYNQELPGGGSNGQPNGNGDGQPNGNGDGQPDGIGGGQTNGIPSQNIDDTIISKSQARMNDPEINTDSNVFKDTGKDHDFSADEKEYIVNSYNDHQKSDDYCIRKTENISPDVLSETGSSANPGDCLVIDADNGAQEDSDLYGSLKNNKEGLEDIIEILQNNKDGTSDNE